MGCSASTGVTGVDNRPIAQAEVTESVGTNNDEDKNEDKTEDNKGNKKIRVDRFNNNHKGSDVMHPEDGTTIHVPGGIDAGHNLQISNKSPNQQIAEKLQELEDDKRKQDVKKQKEKEQEGKKNAERKGLLNKLKNHIEVIKKTYSEVSLASHEIVNAETRVRRYGRSTSLDTSPRLDTSRYEMKRLKLYKTQQEKSRLLHKLSEIASAKLRHNNANVADLSDPNRATKLAERLSELYDNEWTDVFDAVRKMTNPKDVDDRAIVKSLLDILRCCYSKCKELSSRQTELLYQAVRKPQTKTQIELTLQIRDLQKRTVQDSKSAFQRTIRNHVGQSTNNDVILKRIGPEKAPLLYYINLCSEISWYMHIQSPPLDLDFIGIEFTTTRFRPYLTSGPELDYIVWPALLLHESGPLVAKGVAQFRKSKMER